MKSGAGAIIFGVILGSLGTVLGADGVAPTKAEVVAIYNNAVEQLHAGNYAETLKQLDLLEARQPELATAKNLRGVTLMRMKEYGLAEKALQKARELDPNLWEARFNLAELSFLQKKWAEARERFEALASEPEGSQRETTRDLIQFKIFLSYLLGGREKEAARLRDRFESLGENPLRYYARAALAFRDKDETSARVNLRAAEKSSSRASHEVFLESFHDVGWMEEKSDSPPVTLEAESKGDRLANARNDFKKAQYAFRTGEDERALELLEKVEEAAPNQAVVYNLRGEILLAQGKLDAAETALRNALVANPELEEARFNLALVPFKKHEYETARKEFEALLGATSGANQERERDELIRYHIYLALLLEGRDAAAQKALEEFKMLDQTPALYYAQAAWAFRHENPKQADNWIANAGNLFAREANRSFAAPLTDIGWVRGGGLPSPTPVPIAAGPTPVAIAEGSTTETSGPVAAANEVQATPTPSPPPKSSGRETKVAAIEEEQRTPSGEKSETGAKKKKRKARTRERAAEGEEETSRTRRTASRARSGPKASPSPTPAPAPAPEVVARPARENLGDKVRNLILYPFKHREKESAAPTPTPLQRKN